MECYNVLVDNATNVQYQTLVQRLALDLNHDTQIKIIAEEIEKNNSDGRDFAEIRYEIENQLNDITRDNEG